MNGPEELPGKKLSPAKQQLLKKLLAANGAAPGQAKSAGIPLNPWRPEYPLSFAQRRLWFMAQMEADAALYNVVRAFRLEGPLDLDALEKSFAALIQRHAILRACFKSHDGDPVQVIANEMPLSCARLDLRAHSAEERDSALAGLLRKEADTGFDLSRGPLIRFLTAALGPQSHALIIVFHHTVIDDWSLGIFLKELSICYNSLAAGRACSLPPLPIQYTDFAIWQNRQLESGELAAQLEYWQKQLAGMPLSLNLPRPAKAADHSSHGGRLLMTLPAKLNRELRKFCQFRSITLFEALLAAFNILLACYSGGDDVAIGTVISNRDREELEPLLGFLTNMLVLRTAVPARSTFAQIIEQTRTVLLDAHSNKDLPFEHLVRMLLPDRRNISAPLVQIMFVLQNAADASLALKDVACSALPRSYTATNFDLDFALEQSAEELRLIAQYRTDAFDAAMVRCMVSVYKNILQAMIGSPDCRVIEAPLLTPEERAHMLSLNPLRTEWPAQRLHELFEAQARRTPESIALQYGDRQLTYRQLNQQANQLARYLKRLGIGPETTVGIYLKRGIETVLAALAALKFGGAYVPLDPDNPPDRLACMLQDARAKALLLDSGPATWASGTGVQTVDLRQVAHAVERESTEDPDGAAEPENLAYIIYTSDPTGRPNGVMVPHRAICNHLLWRQKEYPLNPADRFLHKASFSFDIAVWEMFWPLLAGARVVIAAPGGQQDSRYLARLIASERVTVAHFDPSMLKVFLEEPGVRECHDLRRVFCGGESMSVELKQKFFSRVAAELYHQYGPTETTVDVLFWNCSRDSGEDVVPGGRPIANTSAYILDADMQLAPIDVAGELHLGGDSLARGYLNRPDLTADRFVPDPFSHSPGRLFRTGDLARCREGGAIEFIGRMDRQVKLHGFRIELEEIESVLRTHPAIRDAAVALRAANGDPMLVAYVAGESSAAELQEHLARKLPAYMLPSAFVVLPNLPRTANGKLIPVS